MSTSGSVIQFSESLDVTSAKGALREVTTVLAAGERDLVFDLATVRRFDSAGVGAMLLGIRQARESGVEVKMHGMSAELLDFFSLVSVRRLTGEDESATAREDFVSRVGGHFLPLLETSTGVVKTAADGMRAIAVGPFRGRRWRWDRIAVELDSSFLGALPVVLLIGFLLGLILAMQAYVQLQVWGADIYMANMVGVSVVYEIGPLMTGIILAARSGSSNAAQLGAMVVSEEIDAINQMGIRPVNYLVLPKILALSFSVMALGIVFDYIAIVGGALFAYLVAGIEPNAYMERTSDALQLSSFLLASTKCVVFGAFVGIIGCALGLRVTGGSEGVARATTNAVVFSIFAIIVIDAGFVVVQQLWPS